MAVRNSNFFSKKKKKKTGGVWISINLLFFVTDTSLLSFTMSKIKLFLMIELVLLLIIWIWVIIATAVTDWSKSSIGEYGIWRACSLVTTSKVCENWNRTEMPARFLPARLHSSIRKGNYWLPQQNSSLYPPPPLCQIPNQY